MGEVSELMMVTGIAFLRPLLQRYGLDADCGLTLIFDSEHCAHLFEKAATKNLNAMSIRSLKETKNVRNFAMGLHVYKQNEDISGLIEFLLEDKFFPIVLVGSRIPAALREEGYFMRMSVKDPEQVEKFVDRFENFKSYVIQNVHEVSTALSRLRRSKLVTESRVDDEYGKIRKCLKSVGHIWKLSVWATGTEAEAEDFWRGYLSAVDEVIGKFGDYAGAFELGTEIVELVWNYIGSHVEVKISLAEKVSTSAFEAIKKNEAVLFDADYYYFPEKLVKTICLPLMDVMSRTELKEKLKGDGIIQCNGDGFTVKKKFWTVSGTSGRYRALKFPKDVLVSVDGFRLEDMYGENEATEETCYDMI